MTFSDTTSTPDWNTCGGLRRLLPRGDEYAGAHGCESRALSSLAAIARQRSFCPRAGAPVDDTPSLTALTSMRSGGMSCCRAGVDDAVLMLQRAGHLLTARCRSSCW